MIEERGIVLDVRPDGMAVIMAKKTSACEECGSKALCKGMSESDMKIEARNEVGAKRGDTVVFTVGASEVIKAGVYIYLFPMLGFITGAVLAQYFAPKYLPTVNADIASAIAAFVLMLIVYFSVTFLAGRKSDNTKSGPQIIRIENH